MDAESLSQISALIGAGCFATILFFFKEKKEIQGSVWTMPHNRTGRTIIELDWFNL